MASIADLKKKSKELNTDALKGKMEDKTNYGNNDDDRIWRPFYDKMTGKARATIRFLPPHPDEDDPFVKVYSHGFQGENNKWYIENSLTTLGKDDPVTEMNSRLWNSGVEENKDFARKYKRQVNYYSNVLVIDDPANPDNNGQVKIYRYGQMVFNMIKKALEPEFEDDPSLNPFDVFEGADFDIRIYTEKKFPKYDKCSFKESSVLFDGDEDKIEEVWNQCHKLKPFVDTDNFKSYESLQERLFTVLGPMIGADGNQVPVVLGNDVPKEDRSRSNQKTQSDNVSEDLDDEIPNYDEPETSSSSSDVEDDDMADFDSIFDDD